MVACESRTMGIRALVVLVCLFGSIQGEARNPLGLMMT